ncbi:MAG: DUF2384 domain-containing protein [Gemmatimonadetes bacterium]|nr:DUF2384 domain-containing protein [Gemmatimonadota bacterium]
MSPIDAAEALGGAQVLGAAVESELDFVHLVEEGLPTRVIERLKELGDLSDAELARIIPRRTLSHVKGRKRLSAEQSDRIARAASVFARAREVFGNRAKANHWMRQPNRALEGAAPLELLRTGSGASLVESILTRVAYGVYS